jgi:hypothetical protein
MRTLRFAGGSKHAQRFVRHRTFAAPASKRQAVVIQIVEDNLDQPVGVMQNHTRIPLAFKLLSLNRTMGREHLSPFIITPLIESSVVHDLGAQVAGPAVLKSVPSTIDRLARAGVFVRKSPKERA